MSCDSKTARWKPLLVLGCKLALTSFCLWWAFHGVNLHHSVFINPEKLEIGWLMAAIAMGGVAVFFNAWRWWWFLRAQEVDVSIARAVKLTLIGTLFNLVSVGGLGGDAARIWLLIKRHRNQKLAVTMSVLGDHMAGLVALALLFFAISGWRFDAIASPSVLGKNLIHVAWVIFGGGMGALVLLFVLTYPPINRRIHANGREWKWECMRRVPIACDEFRRKWREGIAGILVSCLMMLAYATSFWCALRAVGGTSPASAVISAMPVIDAISALPVSVGGIGVREKLFQVLLGDLAGVSATIAVSASLIGFACHSLWALAGAGLMLHSGGPKIKIEA